MAGKEEINFVLLSELQNSSDPEMLTYSSQVLSYMLMNNKFHQQFRDSGLHPLRTLVSLCTHEERWVREQALISLTNLSFIKNMREYIVQSGALELLSEKLLSSEPSELINLAVIVLCNCICFVDDSSKNQLEAILKALIMVLEKKYYVDVHPLIILGLGASIHRKHMREILSKYDLLSMCFLCLRSFLDNNIRKWYEEHLHHKDSLESETCVWMDESKYCNDTCWLSVSEWYTLSSHCPLSFGCEPNNFSYFVDERSGSYLTVLDMKYRLSTSVSNIENTDFNEMGQLHCLSSDEIKEVGFKYLSYLNSKYVSNTYAISMSHYQTLLNFSGPRMDHPIFTLIKNLCYYYQLNLDILSNMEIAVLFDYVKYIANPSDTLKTVTSRLKLRYPLDYQQLVMNGFLPEILDNNSLPSFPHIDELHSRLTSNNRHIRQSLEIDTLCDMLKFDSKFVRLNAIRTVLILHPDRTPLLRFFLQENGIDHLINILSGDSHTLRKKAMICLWTLYGLFTWDRGVARPVKTSISRYCGYYRRKYDVTFLLDSGKKIRAVRRHICNNSQYFKALLDGHFVENNASFIVFHDISDANMLAILHFLHGNGTLCLHVDQSFSSLLDLLADCEKFLLDEMKRAVEQKLCEFNKVESLSELYMHAKACNSETLVKRVIHFLLITEPEDESSLWRLYYEFSKSGAAFYRCIKEVFLDILK